MNFSFLRLQPDFEAKLKLDLDCFGSETSWEIINSNGEIMYSDGPFEDDMPGLIEYTMCLSWGCYDMIIHDEYGDGLSGCSSAAGGNGSYKLTLVSNGLTLSEITEANANFGDINIANFCVTSTFGLDQIQLENLITLYPNPGKNSLHIKAENVKVENVRLYNVAGQEVLVQEISNNSIEINTTDLPAAFYIVKIKTNQGELNQRWIKQ